MIHLEKLTIADLLSYELLTEEELGGLREEGATDHEIKRAIGVFEQLRVSYCARRERLPDLRSIHEFSTCCVAFAKGRDEEMCVIDAIREAHQAYVETEAADSQTDPNVCDSVRWAVDAVWRAGEPP